MTKIEIGSKYRDQECIYTSKDLRERERERIQSKALYHISKTLKTNNIKT